MDMVKTNSSDSSRIHIKPTKLCKKVLLFFLLAVVPSICFAEYFSFNASYEVCFTPGDDCANKIIREISQAKGQVLVQAYSFTSRPIANELIKAKRKGIDVRIILDKSQLKTPYSLVKLFKNNKVVLTIDHLPAIAHNKVIIIDKSVVIGGSYNYSQSAEKSNAENVIIIKDAGLAKKYIENWHARERKSVAVGRSRIRIPKVIGIRRD